MKIAIEAQRIFQQAWHGLRRPGVYPGVAEA